MPPLRSLSGALCVALLSLPVPGRPGMSVQEDDLLSSGAVREVVLDGPPGTRVEYFRLDHESTDLGRLRPQAPVGLVRWVTGPDSEAPSGWRSELDVRFPAEKVRVLHTESLRPDERELIFREMGPRHGRTLRLVWTPDGKATLTEAGGPEILRRELDVGNGAFLPLSLVELARRGERWDGEVRCFQPLAGELDALDLRVIEAGADRRTLVLSREGRGAGRYEFEGESLVRFRWQEGGLVARRLTSGEHARLSVPGPPPTPEGR